MTYDTDLTRAKAGAALAALITAFFLAAGGHAAEAATATIEGETMQLTPGAGTPYDDAGAQGGRALLMWSNGTASATVTTGEPARLAVRARGDQCKGAPAMVVRVDGNQVLSTSVPSSSFTETVASGEVRAGSHSISVSFTNDFYSRQCDRNLRVDAITLQETAPTGSTDTTSNPLAGAKLYVDPYSNAKRQADEWRASRPADAAEMDKIANRPQADWFGDWSGDVAAAVGSRVGAATAAGALPVLVAYDIPQRDCGSYSAGGAGSPEAYRSWIRAFAEGIGTRKAVVVLEPDALAGIDCLSDGDRRLRLDLLRDAVSVLEARPGVSVYLDGGHSFWIGAAEMASRLTAAGIEQAQGFALNVSNFRLTSELVAYGKDLSSRVGGKHFVLDTSRNGLGPDGSEWCNPSGRALGPAPTASTGEGAVDAYLWIKRPGESDGTCNGGPSAGAWWADYALGLARRSGSGTPTPTGGGTPTPTGGETPTPTGGGAPTPTGTGTGANPGPGPAPSPAPASTPAPVAPRPAGHGAGSGRPAGSSRPAKRRPKRCRGRGRARSRRARKTRPRCPAPAKKRRGARRRSR